MAKDLRLLAAVIEISTELERMGDYAKGIAKINILMGLEPLIKPLIDIPRMADLSIDMLHRSLGAFVAKDVKARAKFHKKMIKLMPFTTRFTAKLVTYMIADTSTIDQANFLLWAAHNLERLADRVTNICERTIYMATGEMRELDRTDDQLIHFENEV